MTGLVAVVADEADGVVASGEVERLADAYEELRGRGERHAASAGTRAHVIQLVAPGGQAEPVERDGASWAVVAGVAHRDGPLVGARPNDLDGQFALVAHDAASGDVTVASDPFSMQALHVARRDGLTYVSTSALALAKHLRARPSRLGLLSFLRAGYHFGTTTNWDGIDRLDPATTLRFGRDGVERSVYWQPSVDEHVRGLPFPRVVDHCLEVGVDALARYLRVAPRSWADLTGGYDSRLLALLLRRARVDFDTDTRGTDDRADVRIAREIASRLDLRWRQLQIPAEWDELLPSLVDRALSWGDANLEVVELSWVLYAHEQLARENPALLIGGGGEHYRGFAWRQEFLRGGRSTHVNWDHWLDMRLLHPMNTSVFVEDPTPEVREDFRRRMAARAAPYAGELNSTQLDVLYAYKMTGHFGAYRSADGAHLRAELPFYFRPLFTAAFSTRPRFRDNHRLMRHMIERLDGAVAAIPTATGGPAQVWRPTNLHRFVPYYTRLGRRAVTKLSQKTLGRPLFPLPPKFRDIGDARAAVVDALGGGRPLTHADLRSGSLYRPAEIDDLLRRAREDGFSDNDLFGRMLTVELALRATDAALD